MNEIQLIALYCYTCKCYDTHLRWLCERFSKNSSPDFSDVECLTIYIYSVMEEEKFKIKSIHQYAKKYLLSWFPTLPSYVAFNNRLNRLSEVFPVLVSHLLEDVDRHGIDFNISLIDSMPIITCSGKRAGKVAPQLTSKGYCSTKKLHYYGAKLHGIAFHRLGKLPMPEIFGISPASEHDLNAVRELLPQLKGRYIFADKAYANKELNESLQKNAQTSILTPVKKVKGESQLLRDFNQAADGLFSASVSRVRQPIEGLFNWLIEKTDIQRASKVRSAKGLIVHVFGRIAAAIALWVF